MYIIVSFSRDGPKDALFRPLGMHDTSFSVPDEKLHRLAACYGNASTWGRLYGTLSGRAPRVSRTGLVRLDGDSPEESAWRRGQECKIQCPAQCCWALPTWPFVFVPLPVTISPNHTAVKYVEPETVVSPQVAVVGNH